MYHKSVSEINTLVMINTQPERKKKEENIYVVKER